MAKISGTVADLKSLSEKFKAIIEVTALLEEIGDLEEAKRLANLYKDKAIKECDAAEAKLSQMQEDLEALKEDRKNVDTKVMEKLADAQASYESIQKEAHEKAKGIVKSSHEQKMNVDKSIVYANEQLAALKNSISQAKSELVSIQQSILDTKARIAAI